MQEIILKIRYFKIRLSKTLKKSTLFFLLYPVLFNGQKNHQNKSLSYSKNYICKSMHAKSWYHINYYTSICPFETWNCGKKGKNYRIWISWGKGSFFGGMGGIFCGFWGTAVWGGIWICRKMVDTSFKLTFFVTFKLFNRLCHILERFCCKF